jgi:hypothetical protein
LSSFLITKSKNASNIAQKLHKMAFKKEVVSELLHLYYDNKFMEKLPTTEEIIKKYKDNGRANIRLTISSVKDINKLDEKKIVNEDFNSMVKGLLKMNKNPLKFVTKPSKFSKK